jgi:hypothetical protein
MYKMTDIGKILSDVIQARGEIVHSETHKHIVACIGD